MGTTETILDYQNIIFKFVVPSATLVRPIARNTLGSHNSKPVRFDVLQHLYWYQIQPHDFSGQMIKWKQEPGIQFWISKLCVPIFKEY